MQTALLLSAPPLGSPFYHTLKDEAMRVSRKGLLELICHEGIVPMPYFDSVGVLTFGIGHTKAAGKPNPASLPTY